MIGLGLLEGFLVKVTVRGGSKVVLLLFLSTLLYSPPLPYTS